MRIDTDQISKIIKDFIKTYIDNTQCNDIVLGLSGSIDSAVTTVLCVDAIGNNHVKCLFLSDDRSNSVDIKHIELLQKKFKFSCKILNVKNILRNIIKCIKETDKPSIANIKSRLGMILLYEYANVTNSIVCGTLNKSDILIGHFTKYGDGGVDMMPIGDLYRTQVYQLAKYLGIPDKIINIIPKSKLLENQFDEIELGYSYKLLDRILLGLEQKLKVSTIVKNTGIKKTQFESISKLVEDSQHKRQFPLIPKLGIRTPGFDWRLPIINNTL
jgi:NAD+ synthase